MQKFVQNLQIICLFLTVKIFSQHVSEKNSTDFIQKRTLTASDSIEYSIPCTEAIKTEYSGQFTFIPDRTTLSLSAASCAELDGQVPTDISVNIVRKFGDDIPQCDIKTLQFDTTTCAKEYSVKINTITMNEGNEKLVNQDQILMELDDFGFGGMKNIEMNYLKLQKHNKTVTLAKVGDLIFNHCQFGETRIYSGAQFLMTQIDNLVMKKTVFKNQKCDFRTSCAIVVTMTNKLYFEECTFQGQETTWLGAAMTLLGIQNATMYKTLFKDNYSAYTGGNIAIINVEYHLAEQCIFDNVQAAYYGGAYFIQGGSMYLLRNSVFKKNKALQKGGAILTFYSPGHVVIDSSRFEDNSANEGGAIYLAYSILFTVKNSTFIRNKAVGHGGAILQGVSPHTYVENSVFIENVSEQGKGGAIGLENVDSQSQEAHNEFMLYNNTFIRNKAVDGGGLSIQSIPFLKSNTTVVKNQTFIENEATQGSGGGLFLDSLNQYFPIETMTFIGNKAKISGGGMMAQSIKNLDFIDFTFEGNSAAQGGAIELSLNSINLYLKDVTVKQNTALGHGGGLKINKLENVTLENFVIQNNTCLSFGGAIYSSKCDNLSLKNVEMKFNNAQLGGGQYLHESQNIAYENVKILYNNASNFAAGIRAIKTDNVTFQEAKISHNIAKLEVGAVFLQLSNNTHFLDSEFDSNLAQQSKGCLQVAMQNNLTIRNSKFVNNVGYDTSGALYIFQSENLELHGLNVTGNENKGKQGAGITIIRSKVFEIHDCRLNENMAQEQGGALQISECEGIDIRRTSIMDNYAAQKGGGVLITESSDLKLYQLRIENNRASLMGAGVFLKNTSNLEMKESNFTMNVAEKGDGAGLSVIDDSNDIHLEDIIIKENSVGNNGGALFLQNSKKISLKRVEMTENTAKKEGPGIYANTLSELVLDDVSFSKHINVDEGGAIHAKNIQQFKIKDSLFSDNNAIQNGGAIFSENIDDLNIENTQFLSNYLQKSDSIQDSKGGTIFVKKAQNVNMLNSSIVNSYAYLYGGGIYAESAQNLNIQSSKLLNNTVKFDQKTPLEEKNSDYTLSQGGAIYYEPKDIDNNNSPEISLEKVYLSNCAASSGGSVLINQKPSQKIKINIKNVQFSNSSSDIGPSVRFIGVSGINEQMKISNVSASEMVQILGNMKQNGFYFGYYYNEKVKDSDSSHFELCLKGQYLREGGTPICTECLKNGLCEGGYKPVLPLKEYWRDSVESYNFIHCENNPDVCLGEDKCQEGHIGVLCEQCDRVNKYSLSKSENECQKCATNKTLIVIEMILVFVLVVLFIFNQIYGVTMRINKQLLYRSFNLVFDLPVAKVTQLSASTKILIMHFQILYIAVKSQVKQFQEFIQNLQIVGSPQSQFARNLECLVDFDKNEDIKKIEYYLSFYGLLILVGTVCIVILCEILCRVFKKIIKKTAYLFQIIQCTILIFFLFVQPAMVQNSLEYLKIRTINGIDYCYANTFIEADTDFYTKEIVPYNLCVVILLGFIFPAVLTLFLWYGKKKKITNKLYFTRKLGILYLEYKDKVVFWELLLIFLKVIIVVIASQLQDYKSVKGIFIVFLLVGYLFLCLKVWPYQTKMLNNQAIISCLILILTVGALTNFEDSEISESFQIFLNILIIIFNIIFLGYSGYIMLLDFKQAFRQTVRKYCKFAPKLQDKLLKQGQDQHKAVLRWKNLKKSILSSVNEVKETGQLDNFHIVFLEKYMEQQQTFYAKQNGNMKDITTSKKQYGLHSKISLDNIYNQNQYFYLSPKKKKKTELIQETMVTPQFKKAFENTNSHIDPNDISQNQDMSDLKHMQEEQVDVINNLQNPDIYEDNHINDLKYPSYNNLSHNLSMTIMKDHENSRMNLKEEFKKTNNNTLLSNGNNTKSQFNESQIQKQELSDLQLHSMNQDGSGINGSPEHRQNMNSLLAPDQIEVQLNDEDGNYQLNPSLNNSRYNSHRENLSVCPSNRGDFNDEVKFL